MSFLGKLVDGLKHDMEVYHNNRDKVCGYEGTAERSSVFAMGADVLAKLEAEDRIKVETDSQKKRKMQALYDAGIYNFDLIFDYVDKEPM